MNERIGSIIQLSEENMWFWSDDKYNLDEETGQAIFLRGATFRIYDCDDSCREYTLVPLYPEEPEKFIPISISYVDSRCTFLVDTSKSKS
jgi:hypothetical protein